MNIRKYHKILQEHNLKTTPQRIAVLDAINKLTNHPTADNIIEYIKAHHPGIAIGTVYNILETFVEKGLIVKIKTERDVMRYESMKIMHHHLYNKGTDRIEDYMDTELDNLLTKYFEDKKIPGFDILKINLEITGTFTDKE